MKNVRLTWSQSQSRRQSLATSESFQNAASATSSREAFPTPDTTDLEKAYHQQSKRSLSLGRPHRRSVAGQPNPQNNLEQPHMEPHMEIEVQNELSSEALGKELTKRIQKNITNSADIKFTDSAGNLRNDSSEVLQLHRDVTRIRSVKTRPMSSHVGSNNSFDDPPPALEKGLTMAKKDLARVKTGSEAHRSNSIASVKFHTTAVSVPPALPPIPGKSSDNDNAVLHRAATKGRESVKSTGSNKPGDLKSMIRSLIIRFLYLPSFTEFGFTLSHEKGSKQKSKDLEEMQVIHLIVLYEVPVIAAFETKLKATEFSAFLTVVFITDIFINLFSLKIVDGTVDFSIVESRLQYLKRGLILDVVAAVPFDVIIGNSAHYSETLMLIRLLYSRRIGKIFQENAFLMQFSRWIQKSFRIGVSFMRIFLLGGILITFLHIHGCLVFLFGKITGFSGDSWKKVEYLFDETVKSQYIWSLFVATANTFPVTGFQPSDATEQVVSIVLAILGAVLYAALVGTISSFSFGLDSSGRKYKEKIDEVNEYMTYRNLSDSIKKKVRDYFAMKYRGKFFDEDAILSEMNDSLRLEIAIHNCQDLIAKVPFLRREMDDGRDELFMGRIAKVLKPKYFVKGDIIFEQGWVGNEMYFILKGNVAIVVNNKVVGNLADGAFFGEVALLGEVPRTATIRASTNTVLYCFERQDFNTIIADYSDMAARIKQVYEERMVKVKKENEDKEKALIKQPS
ncbi:hypothetical protein HDU97_000809 [Phlyctochytrium planicorne]|nr:hypothetical protein HDU97_000809 [Phlyctochytrium planicorne]